MSSKKFRSKRCTVDVERISIPVKPLEVRMNRNLKKQIKNYCEAENINSSNHHFLRGKIRKDFKVTLTLPSSDEIKTDGEQNRLKVRAVKSPSSTPAEKPRRVENPFFKKRVANSSSEVMKRSTSSAVGEILKTFSAKPKTIKERLQNEKAFQIYNEDHQDDLFEDQSKFKSGGRWSTNLLGEPEDSDNDLNISNHSPRTPLLAFFGKKTFRDFESPTPPEFAKPPTPTITPRITRFQRQAYIQKKLAEKRKNERINQKSNTKSAHSTVSRSQMDKMVGESTKVISSAAVRRTLNLDESQEEEWFEDDTSV